VLLATKRVVLAVRQNTHGFKTHSTNNGVERFQREFFLPSIFDAKEAAEIWFVFRIPAIATAFQPKDNGSQERVEVEAAHHLGAAQVGGTSLTTG